MEKALGGFERVRIDLDEAPGEGKRFDVHGIPLILVLGPDGRELTRRPGYESPEDLLELIAAVPAPAAAAAPK